MRAGNMIDETYEVVVVGGGLSGVCAALASARHGARTVLIHDRPSLGGNASPEIKMHVCGASCGGTKEHLRETGIIEELLLENRKRNPAKSFYVFSTILWEKVRFQAGLTLRMNTHMLDCGLKDSNNKQIEWVTAVQMTTQKRYKIYGKQFIDCTGDGNLCWAAGIPMTVGREAKSQFEEIDAPDKADSVTLGSTLMFKAKDMGKPTPFTPPSWANHYTEDQLRLRPHTPTQSDMEIYGVDAGFWWIELGGSEQLPVLEGAEDIHDQLLRVVYGVWDHLKNQGDHGADHYALDWVQMLPGKRESRRIQGQYTLTQNDILEHRQFPDTVAYGGWPMDIHAEGGILNTQVYPTNFIKFEGCYSIPYRCFLPKEVDNLMVAGRIISASHLAFGSTRVMGTCAVGGQAVGTAAAMTITQGCMPGDLLQDIGCLQQQLLRDDCYIPGIVNLDPDDLALQATVTANWLENSHELMQRLQSGVARDTQEAQNGCPIPVRENESPCILTFRWPTPVWVGAVELKWDSDLSNERQVQISLDSAIQAIPFACNLPSLVCDYRLAFSYKNRMVATLDQQDTYQRFMRHNLQHTLLVDEIQLFVLTTNGNKDVTLFEMRVYSDKAV